MVSPRAMLAGEFTVAQGIAMAFTLSLDPIPGEVAARSSGSPATQDSARRTSRWAFRTRRRW